MTYAPDPEEFKITKGIILAGFKQEPVISKKKKLITENIAEIPGP